MKFILLITTVLLTGCTGIYELCSCNIQNLRSFNFSYEVQINPTMGKKLEMWLPFPISNEVQTITNLEIDAGLLNYQIMNENKHGNQYLYIHEENGTVKPVEFSLTFDVIRKEHQNIMYDEIEPADYLGSHQKVPTGQIFSSIIKQNTLSEKDIRGIYDFVLSGMHYGKPKSAEDKYYQDPWLEADGVYGTKKVSRDDVVAIYQQSEIEGGDYTFGKGNSIYACDIGVGNCTDYHSYFMSLGRTLNIPVRFHMGFLIPSETEGIVGGYHCWADFYVDGEGWYPVDISEADKNPVKLDYYFGTVCNNRVDMIVGRDFKLEGSENEITNLFIYPIMEVDDVKSTDYSKKFSYKNI